MSSATLIIRQQPAATGHHLIRLALKRPGHADQEADASIEFSLTDQEQHDIRWYMEDYLQHAETVEPVHVEQI